MSTKRAALINDLSGLGKCSLTAAIPVFSCMGIQPCPLPTAVLSNQTGYDSYYIDDFTDKMSFFTEEWLKKGITFDAISTGFFVNSKQIDISEEFIKKFKKEDTLLVVDPVMGDGGTVYKTFSDELCRRICRLALTADVITPNLTEACIILGEKPDLSLSLENVCDMARRLKEKGPSKVVVTGVVIGDKVYIKNHKSALKIPESAKNLINTFPRHALHAATLGFVHPITKEYLEFSSELPDDFQNLLNNL